MTLAPQRALCAISQKKPDQLAPAIGALYHSFWVEGNAKIGQVEAFQPVLEKVLGKDGTQDILAAVGSPFPVPPQSHLGTWIFPVSSVALTPPRRTNQKSSPSCRRSRIRRSSPARSAFRGSNALIARARPKDSGALIISGRLLIFWG